LLTLKLLMKKLVILFFLFATPGIFAQNYYRLRVDVTVKKKLPDGKFTLSKGTVYYDNITGKLVSKLWFPYKETYVMIDKQTFYFKDGKFVSSYANPIPPETSIFALVLKNSIQYYGLENSGYKLEKVEEDKGLVISTWTPPANLAKAVGKVMIANKNGQIYGIIFYDTDGKIVSKQFFEGYKNINGIMFPTRMVQFFYDNQGHETIQKTEFDNIVIDEKGHNDIYDFPVARYTGASSTN